ncbi:hypothetical protein HYALB_00002977 [Hymenoscyphus albidus]|uniref:Ubiquitin-like protease family profile domain-containing protein n=1 Tax=Hymenoscyphus albidus TaxID=595503 RepID=A0A9N9M6J9_9HELO|nr:hypothetical protein HYALB_00002977 [Hymenoscyphus albidus]
MREHRYFLLENSPSKIPGYLEGVGFGIEDKDSKRKPKFLEDKNNDDDDDDNDDNDAPPTTKRIKTTKAAAIDLTENDGDIISEKDKSQVVENTKPPVRSSGDVSTESRKDKSRLGLTGLELEQATNIGKEIIPWTNGTLNYPVLKVLGDGEWLNDEPVNFWIGLLVDRLIQRDQKLAGYIHALDTFLYASPVDQLKDIVLKESWTVPVGIPGQRKTKREPGESILLKDYIIVPIHDGDHFYVAIICNPHDLLNDNLEEVNKREDSDPAHPWIILMDSFQYPRRRAVYRL